MGQTRFEVLIPNLDEKGLYYKVDQKLYSGVETLLSITYYDQWGLLWSVLVILSFNCNKNHSFFYQYLINEKICLSNDLINYYATLSVYILFDGYFP